MNRLYANLNTYRPYVLALVRIVAAYLFLLHGTSKLFSLPATQMSGVPLTSMAGVAGVLEVAGGVLLILGLLTRPVAFLLSGQMAVAYFMVHVKPGTTLLPVLNGGDAAILFCFIFLYFVFAGPGAWAIDNRIGKSHV